MYNAEIKKRFIQDHCVSIKTAAGFEAIFNEVAKFENEWGGDICTQSTDKLSPVLENLFGCRQRGKQQKISMLKEYVKWCMDHQIPGSCDGLLKVEVSGLSKIRSSMVASPAQLQVYLNQICDPESEKTTDLVIRCFYWMAFAGMKEEDIQQVTGENLDFDSMLIRFGEDTYEIYREGVLALKLSATLTEFVYQHPNYQDTTLTIRNRVPGKELIRGIKGKSTISNMRTQLSRRSKLCVSSGKTTTQLSYNRARMSGLFYRTRMMELYGVKPDFSSEASEFLAGKEYSPSSGGATGAMLRKTANAYLTDYNCWKEAFSL